MLVACLKARIVFLLGVGLVLRLQRLALLVVLGLR